MNWFGGGARIERNPDGDAGGWAVDGVLEAQLCAIADAATLPTALASAAEADACQGQGREAESEPRTAEAPADCLVLDETYDDQRHQAHHREDGPEDDAAQ